MLEFDPAVGGSSITRWDGANSPHTGGRSRDVEVAPDGTVWVTIDATGANPAQPFGFGVSNALRVSLEP